MNKNQNAAVVNNIQTLYNDYMKTKNIKILEKIKKQLHEQKFKEE